MQGIQNIIFDLGGVILNIDNLITEKAFESMGARDFHRYFGHGFAASFFRDYEIGRISDTQFIDQLRQLTGTSVPDQAIVKGWNAMLLDFPAERIDLLKKLGEKYTLYLFSNTNALHLAELRNIYARTFDGGSLEAHFTKAYYSHLLRLRKPDLASFRHIIEENKLDPRSTLFVDDALVNVEGANAAGLVGYYLKPGMSILEIPW